MKNASVKPKRRKWGVKHRVRVKQWRRTGRKHERDFYRKIDAHDLMNRVGVGVLLGLDFDSAYDEALGRVKCPHLIRAISVHVAVEPFSFTPAEFDEAFGPPDDAGDEP